MHLKEIVLSAAIGIAVAETGCFTIAGLVGEFRGREAMIAQYGHAPDNIMDGTAAAQFFDTYALPACIFGAACGVTYGQRRRRSKGIIHQYTHDEQQHNNI